MTSQQLEQAVEGLHTVGQALETMAEKHQHERLDLQDAPEGLAEGWVSPQSDITQADITNLIGQLRPVSQALYDAANTAEVLAATASRIAEGLAREEEAVEDATTAMHAAHSHVAHFGEGPSYGEASAARTQAKENIEDYVQQWTDACGRVESTISPALSIVRAAANIPTPDPSFPVRLTYDPESGQWSVVGDADDKDLWELLAGLGLVDGAQPADPAALREQLAGIDQAQLAAMAEAIPDQFGNVDGVPAAVRDVANRQLLEEHLEHLREQGQDSDREFENLDRWLDDSSVQILLFDPAEGQIALGRGDIENADRVNTLVPGSKASIGSVSGMYEPWFNLMHEDTARKAPDDVASIMWLGYDSPPEIFPDAAGSSRAQEGAPNLVSFLDGTIDERQRNSVVGHSYGGVVLGHAGEDLNVDNVVMLGTPGSTSRNPLWASNTFNDDVTVIAGAHSNDVINWVSGNIPIVDYAVHGYDARWSADHVIDLGDPEAGYFSQIDAHNEYLNPGTESADRVTNLLAGLEFEVEQRGLLGRLFGDDAAQVN